ncbi:MAG: glycyl-tRNA synthetase [Parcubacteria group bacterium Gr01-1014_38]|nr:MAG: glycyl-tRNA synthetase [Parcubacteria group bacterium Gr01-1014_38]
MPAPSLDAVANLAKRRGFIVQSSEIYGGAAAAYDYGPLGVELKNNLKRLWWEDMTRRYENIVGLDAAIFMHPKVWEASGHVEAFSDLLVECRTCHKRFRAEEVSKDACLACGAKKSFTEPRKFNLMFRTHLGPTEDAGSTVYLRPETAQGIYADAPYIQQVMRLKLPFGIAQIGKAFRNEVTPGNFIFRTVEFEQAEMQFFVRPSEADRWFEHWKEERMRWYHTVLGFPNDTVRFHPHAKKELAHYAKAADDIQYHFPIDWQEIEGVHNRGDWDLSRHAKFSGKDLSFFDEDTKEKVLPWIIETSAGVDRVLLALLTQAYTEETVKEAGAAGRGAGEKRLVLKLPRHLAPVRAAVFPLLSNNDELVAKAQEISRELRQHFVIQYDDAGAIGRRYRRQDEIGTPHCVTVDHVSLEDNTVTVRDRDTLRQDRVRCGDALIACLRTV